MKILNYIPGVAVPLFIAVTSYYISLLHASFEALILSILLGMFIGNLLNSRDALMEGINLVIRTILPAGIALYGAQLVLQGAHFGFLTAIFLIALSLFGFTMLTSSVFSISREMSLLLASGLSICGASAIAVIAPLIGARRTEISISVISVMMLGMTGVIFYPILNDLFVLTTYEYNFLVGTTLPMLGQVKVAAANVCPECIASALEIKVVRISFLLILIVLAGFVSGNKEERRRVPWFIVVFFILAGLANFTRLLEPLARPLGAASTLSLSTGLAAIGLSVDFDSIVDVGVIPLSIIFIAWIITLILVYIMRSIIYV